MQPRIPRQSVGEQALGPRADGDAGLTDELAAVVTGARRRAVRDGDRQIDTAHLLHSLLEHDPEVRSVFDDGPEIARLLGYLVQRSIGYGLRWQGSVEDSGAVPVMEDSGAVPVMGESDGFSPLAAAAMDHAGERAAARGTEPARGIDLLACLVADPQARAVEVLDRAGIAADAVLARIEDRASRSRWSNR
ncbi:Clp protease N-terminal domain-containing protein [Streptomyces plumbidurans]|uniref:Clp protease N-terminal domain-containing protein n=1 Tax=Streptomyces plumbidurans TaxID=2814589 RepID=UPI0027E051C3|nr:Clp protease N-terminal domain-containing protein [Streptomyces plumbidurans]